MEENTSKAYVGTADPAIGTPATGGGSALFVINLCASIAPVATSGKNLPGLDNYRLYQVARVEDGRTRHRLRLGFFTSESHAEGVLTVVRQQYPTAFTTCLCDEDRKFARGFLPDSALAPAAPAPKRPMTVIANPTPASAPVAPAPAPAAAKSKPAPAAKQDAPVAASRPAPAASKTLTPAEPEVIELSWEPDASSPAPAAAANAASAAKAAELDPDAGLDDLTWEPPALQAPAVSSSDTARHPVLSPGYKTQPVVKAAAPAKPAPAPAARPAAPVEKAAPAAKAVPAAPAAKIAPAAKAAPAAPATPVPAKHDTAASMRVKALELSLSEPPPPPQPQAAKPSGAPFHVGKGVEIADLNLSLQADTPARVAAPEAPVAAKAAPAAASTPAPAKAAPSKPASVAKAPATKTPAAATSATPKAATPPPVAKTPVAPVVPAKAAAPIAPVRALASSALQDLDSTQTIRALTSDEMNDEVQEKWFAIQLAASEQPVNLDTMPHLDIFEAYRLYSVATAGSGKIIHSLRLGFFKEAVSAEAVSGYLKTFFGSPTVLRVSVAEHARFKDPLTSKKTAEAPKTEAKVVDLNHARAARPVIPTVTMEVDTPATGSFNPNATGSFRTSATGTHRAVNATGTHKALKPAAAKSAGSTKRSKSTGATGKHKAMVKKSLSEQLIDEAREVELSESGIRRLPKNDTLLGRLVSKLTK